MSENFIPGGKSRKIFQKIKFKEYFNFPFGYDKIWWNDNGNGNGRNGHGDSRCIEFLFVVYPRSVCPFAYGFMGINGIVGVLIPAKPHTDDIHNIHKGTLDKEEEGERRI